MNQAEALIIGLQLVAENYEDVIKSGLCSGRMKMILNNFSKRSEELVETFWSNMTEEEVLNFQDKVRECEKVIAKKNEH